MGSWCISMATTCSSFHSPPPSTSSSSSSSSSSSEFSSGISCKFGGLPIVCFPPYRRRRVPQPIRMAPEGEKMTRRSPLDFPLEWDKPRPMRRADIFPEFSPMKTPLPTPLPADDPPDEDEEFKEEDEEEEEEPQQEEDPDNPDEHPLE